MKQKILDRLNEIIIEEKGVPVSINSLWTDSELDSLGTVIAIATLDSEYEMFKDIPMTEDALATLDFKTLTVRELIKKCISPTTNTSKQPTDSPE